MIDRIYSAGVHVRDYAEAFDFYVNKLGFEERGGQSMVGGAFWLEVAPTGSQTVLALTPPEPGKEDGQVGIYTRVIFSTDDIYKTYESLASRGVQFVQKPVRQPWGALIAVFQDPDGNTFMLTE